MGKRLTIDKRNENAIRAALKARGGAAEVRHLPLKCSDDETVCTVITNMRGIIKPDPVTPYSIVRLAR